MSRPAILMLADGTVFRGVSVGADGQSVGEVVFNTAMTGYQEILTDPSYCRQHVTLTYPHIGNTGVNEQDNESQRIFASGLIIRDLPLLASNYRASGTLAEFLEQHRVVAIAGIDTRKLTRLVREKGAQAGCIMAGKIDEKDSLKAARDFPGLKGMDLARVVTTNEAYEWRDGVWRHQQDSGAPRPKAFDVVAYDYGIKHNILRILTDLGCRVTVVPATTPAQDVLASKPDGVFLSNGPGDPEPCDYAIEAIREIVDTGLPVFGICLGHQLLALASGARTVKMKFGHHGANHPVRAIADNRVMISSQNHGFAVDDTSLPDVLKVTHVSLFDGSLQGIERTDRPAFGFQGHPEASPGPHDVRLLFERFIALMQEHSRVAPESIQHADPNTLQ